MQTVVSTLMILVSAVLLSVVCINYALTVVETSLKNGNIDTSKYPQINQLNKEVQQLSNETATDNATDG